MNILQLRKFIFNDLSSPLKYLSDFGFCDHGEPDSVRVYGNTAYFYTNGDDWYTLTPGLVLMKSNVNTFRGEEHTCSLTPEKKWIEKTSQQLKVCAKMVYDQGALPLAVKDYASFESFWSACSKQVRNIRLMDYAFTKRGHKKQYINMYNDTGEITGQFDLVSGSTVRASIRWTLYVSTDDGDIHFGFRPSFGRGVHVIKMAGAPPNIRNPWIFKHFNFETFKMPMYESFVVKCPALPVVNSFGTACNLNLSSKPEFKRAMDNFHVKSGMPLWDGTLHLNTSKPVAVGDSVLATVYAVRNKDHIDWYTERIFVLRQSRTRNIETTSETAVTTVGTKRDADNMDNSLGAKTKRQYIQSDIRAHMTT